VCLFGVLLLFLNVKHLKTALKNNCIQFYKVCIKYIWYKLQIYTFIH
jgi:hypothetical protein